MDAAALWIDARLPGRSDGPQPRLRGGFLTALRMLLIVVAIVAGGSLWNSYQRSNQLRTYETATTALAAVQLPGWLHEGPATCGDTVCATSVRRPAQVAPTLRTLIHGVSLTRLDIPCVAANRCPIALIGHYDGALTIGTVFWGFLAIRHRKPANGAIPLHPNLHVKPGQARGYWYGSDVYIDTIDPRSSD
jgi:hypothetical protein